MYRPTAPARIGEVAVPQLCERTSGKPGHSLSPLGRRRAWQVELSQQLAPLLGDCEDLGGVATPRKREWVRGRRHQRDHQSRISQKANLLDVIGPVKRDGQAGRRNLLE